VKAHARRPEFEDERQPLLLEEREIRDGLRHLAPGPSSSKQPAGCACMRAAAESGGGSREGRRQLGSGFGQLFEAEADPVADLARAA
jgi:hypothetical protein